MGLEDINNINDHTTRVASRIIEQLMANNPGSIVQDYESELERLIKDPQTSSPMKAVYQQALAESREHNRDKGQLLAGLAME